MNAKQGPARHLTIRNLPPAVARRLESMRKRRGKSLNQTVIDLLSSSLGLVAESSHTNGLEKLAGSWTDADVRRFERATAPFEQVDEELWK